MPCAKARHSDRNPSRDSRLKPETRRSLKRAIEAFAESTNPNVHRREATKAPRAGRLFERRYFFNDETSMSAVDVPIEATLKANTTEPT